MYGRSSFITPCKQPCQRDRQRSHVAGTVRSVLSNGNRRRRHCEAGGRAPWHDGGNAYSSMEVANYSPNVYGPAVMATWASLSKWLQLQRCTRNPG